MKIKKRILIITVMIMLFATQSVSYASIGNNIQEVKVISSYNNEKTSRVIGSPRGRLISSVELEISDRGNGTIGVYVDLLCHKAMDKMMIWTYLEKWNPVTEDWSTVNNQQFTWLSKDYPDEDLTMAVVSYTVPKQERGKDYRLRVMFGAKELGSEYQETWNASTANLFVE